MYMEALYHGGTRIMVVRTTGHPSSVTRKEYTTLFSAFSLSHAVLRLGTDSLVLLMNALKRKGRVWVGKKYIQDET